jgi:DNA repair ATPase RecN
LRENDAALRELELDPGELARRLELAEHAAAEIEALAPQPGEVEALRARLAAASNAERLVRTGAAVMIPDDELAADSLLAAVDGLDADRLRAMADASRALGRPGAALDILRVLREAAA